MARLSLSLLGPLRVLLDGEPATQFESDKVRALLVYLAVEADRPHRREALAGLLWAECPERTARHALSQALYNLRYTLGDDDATPPFLLITRETLQFNRNSQHWLDVAAFTGLLAVCGLYPRCQLNHCGPCLGRLQQAMALYQGSFLAGFSLPGCAAFEEWALLQRERLHRLAMEASCRLVWWCEQHGKYEEALQHAWQQMELAPEREETHRQLMRLLALSGRRSEALAQYATCRRILAREWGTEPEAETTRLYERIREGEIGRWGEGEIRKCSTCQPSVMQKVSLSPPLPLSLSPLHSHRSWPASVRWPSWTRTWRKRWRGRATSSSSPAAPAGGRRP